MNSQYLVDTAYAVVFLVALTTVIHDLRMGWKDSAAMKSRGAEDAQPVRWRTGFAVIVLAWLPIAIAVISGGF